MNRRFNSWERSFGKHLIEIEELSHTYAFNVYLQASGSETDGRAVFDEMVSAYYAILGERLAEEIEYELDNLPPITGSLQRKFVAYGHTVTYIEAEEGPILSVGFVVTK